MDPNFREKSRITVFISSLLGFLLLFTISLLITNTISRHDSRTKNEFKILWGHSFSTSNSIIASDDILSIKVKDSTVDSAGNCYIIGVYNSDIEILPSINDQNNQGMQMFLVKYDSSGHLSWTLTWPITYYPHWLHLITDSYNNLYIAGDYGGNLDFDPGLSEDIHISNNNPDCFLMKINPQGNFNWVKTWGGSSPSRLIADTVRSVTILPSGDVALAGMFENTVNFDPSIADAQYTAEGMTDIFLCTYSSDGDLKAINFARNNDLSDVYDNASVVLSIKSDRLGNIYMLGWLKGILSMDDKISNSSTVENSFGSYFITKYSSTLRYNWNILLPIDDASGMAIDDDNNIYIISGVIIDNDSNRYFVNAQEHKAGIIKISPDGDLEHIIYWGSSGMHISSAEFINSSNLIIAGNYKDKTQKINNIQKNKVYLCNLSVDGTIISYLEIESDKHLTLCNISVDKQNVYLSGEYQGKVSVENYSEKDLSWLFNQSQGIFTMMLKKKP